MKPRMEHCLQGTVMGDVMVALGRARSPLHEAVIMMRSVGRVGPVQGLGSRAQGEGEGRAQSREYRVITSTFSHHHQACSWSQGC